MSTHGSRNAVQLYNRVNVQSGVDSASPPRVIQILLEGAIARLAAAKGHMQRRETAEKGRHLSATISIIEGMRANLNMEAGGEIANNLNALYEYMTTRLMEANLRNDPLIIDEIDALVREIKVGWDGVTRGAAESGSVGVPAG